jgi:hypothetical protein
LFAEDTTICKQQLQDYIEGRTAEEDGSDLASKLQKNYFRVLNTPKRSV